MKQRVMLNIRGRQAYEDQEPDVIELTTEGTMELRDGGWNITYAESDLMNERVVAMSNEINAKLPLTVDFSKILLGFVDMNG